MFPYLSNKHLPGIEEIIVLNLTARGFASACLVCKLWNEKIRKVLEKCKNKKIAFDQAWRLPIVKYAVVKSQCNLKTIQKCPITGHSLILDNTGELLQHRPTDFLQTDIWKLCRGQQGMKSWILSCKTFSRLFVTKDVLLLKTTKDYFFYKKSEMIGTINST